jgi:putative membrane-bound dehydrogenase-like protein
MAKRIPLKFFVEDVDLRSPVGIAVIGNKVIVSCSPNLIIYTEENGDDQPDKKEIFLTGFGGYDHDHSLHAVYAGPDGNWYFNVGNAGPHIVTDKSGWTLRSGSVYTGGTPYNNSNEGNQKSDDGKVWVGGMALRIKPDGTGLKVMGHNFRNSYEVIPDSYGNLWQNDNDDQVVTCRTSWLMEGGNAGYFSTDGTRYWQADQRPDKICLLRIGTRKIPE